MTLTPTLVFLTTTTGVLALVHLYFVQRLVRDVQLPKEWPRIGYALFAALALSVPLVMVGIRRLPRETISPFAFVGYSWLGLIFLLFVALLVFDALRLLFWATHRVRRLHHPADPARRTFLARVGGGAAAVSAMGGAGYGVATALGDVEVRRQQVVLARLPTSLKGFRLVQLSDVHIGPTLGREFAESLVEQVNALSPDAVVLTGDIVDGSVESLGSLVAPFSQFRSRHGTYLVTGNHEYYSGADAWIAHFSTLGMRVLRNEHVVLRHGSDRLVLAGVDDWTASGPGHGHDIPGALDGRPEGVPTVLLAHQPKSVLEASRHGVDLQLSGHTHGGQIFPFNVLVRLQQPYIAGLALHERTWIYVNRGTGYWGPPMRLGTRSEITCIELA